MFAGSMTRMKFHPGRSGSAAIAFLILFLMVPGLLVAQDTADTDERVQRTPQEIERLYISFQLRIMSPYCPGSNLRDCTSGAAQGLRDRIHRDLEEGRTERWIEDSLIAEFGESILAAPRFKGFNMLVWLAPVIVLLVGSIAIASYLKRQDRMKLAPDTSIRTDEKEYKPRPDLEARLEEEIDARSH